MDSDAQPKSDLLWGFIARAIYFGVVSYLAVLVFAFLRDLFRRLPRRTRTRLSSSPLHLLRWRTVRPDTRIFYYLEIFRLLQNLLVCVIYVIGTYRQNVVRYISITNRTLVGLFILDRINRTLVSESAIASVTSVVAFFDAFTYPSLIMASGPNAYLNFSFLRAVLAYDAFSKLERRLFVHIFGSKRLTGKLVLQCLTLFYTLASGIQLLEIPGDLLSVEFRDKWFTFGDWNFVNSMYFIIVTLSTVGYGDFSPATIQGRIYTVFIIIVGIVVFTTVISQLVEHASRGRGSGWFVKNSHTRHVVVTGTPTMTDLVHFISEFYSDSRRSNIHAKIVVMVEHPLWSDTEWFQYIARNHFLQSRLQFLVGSVRNAADLQRARLSSADAVFILTSPSTGEEPSIQDTRTVINALAVRNVRTDIPIYAQTLLEDSNLQTHIALSTASSFSKGDSYFRRRHMGKDAKYDGLFYKVLSAEYEVLPKVHRKNGRHCFEEVLRHHQQMERHVDIHATPGTNPIDLQHSQHVCLQEIHMALISGNLKANGVGTLLSNMYLDVQTTKLSKEDPAWLAEYHMGAACSLAYAIVPEQLNGAAIREIATDLFHVGVLIIATSHPYKIQPKPILGSDTVLRYGDLVLLLTFHEYEYVGAALNLVALRYSLGELRHTLPSTTASSSTGSNMFPKSLRPEEGLGYASSHPASPRTPIANTREPMLQSLVHLPTLSPGSALPHMSGDDLDALADAEMEERGDLSRGLLRSGTDDALCKVCSDGYMPDDLSGHIILAMEGDAPLRNLPLLLLNLWRRGNRKSTRAGRKAKVVVIHPSIEDAFRERFARFEKISLFFVEGSPASRATWRKAKLHTAKSVATMADYTKRWTLSDARTIFTLLTLDVSTRSDQDLFICSELVDEKSLEFLREPIHPRRRGAVLGEASEVGPSSPARPQLDSPRSASAAAYTTRGSRPGPPEEINEQLHLEPAEGVATSEQPIQKEKLPKNLQKLAGKASQPRKFTGSVKSGEVKSFILNAVSISDGVDSSSDEVGVDPAAKPGAARARRGTLFSRSRYASGELLVQSSAITLLAREYIEPGFVKLFTSVLGTEASSPGMKIRLVRIPKSMFDHSRGFACKKGRKLIRYNDIFKILVSVGVTPLGIYRSGVAPVLIPSRLRRKRGPAIYDELEPLLSRCGCGTENGSQSDQSGQGLFSRASKFLFRIVAEVTPARMREARGQDELHGKVRSSSSNDLSDEEDDYDDVLDGDETSNVEEQPEAAKNTEREPARGGTDSSPESGHGAPSESAGPKARQSSGLASWLSPRPAEKISKFFFDDDESLEVPGQVKYMERKDTANLLPYVFTLPDPNTWCAETDGIYIMCDPSFELPSKWSETTADTTDSDGE